MYIPSKTKIDPPAILIKEAARICDVTSSHIIQMLGREDLDYTFGFDKGGNEKLSGPKMVVKNAKWEDFYESRRRKIRQLDGANWVNESQARKELGLSKKKLWSRIIDGSLTYDEETGRIKKDDSYFSVS